MHNTLENNDITVEEARAILAEHGGYGRVRVYAIYNDESEFANQITAIKSEYHLSKADEYSRIYAVGNNGMVPIRKA